MLDRFADSLSHPGRTLAGMLAKATHALAKLFRGANRFATRHIFPKAFAAASGALACEFVGMADAAMPAPGDITTSAPPPLRHRQDTTILVLLILKVICGHPNGITRNRERKCNQNCKQKGDAPVHETCFPSANFSASASHSRCPVVQLAPNC